MRNLRTYLMIMPLMALALFSCNKKPAATGVELDKQALEMTVGETAQLIATIIPAEAEGIPVTWKSSDPKIASVSDKGLVTAIANGEATITVEVGNLKATCHVTVSEVAVESIKLSKIEMTLSKGSSEVLEVEILPAEAQNTTVTFESSDETIATVDNEGKVTGINVGDAVISVTAGEVSATCDVTVVPAEVTSITLDITKADVVKNETLQLTATVTPENTGDIVVWNSNPTAYASVDDNGLVTALHVGTAIITAKVGDLEATCEINILPVTATSISLDVTELTLEKGAQYELVPTVTPADADNKIEWSTSDENVATVIAGGLVPTNATVTAINDGTATITATIDGVSATCQVTVETTAPMAVGDFYYSDGTTSAELDPDKTPIGIVYWLGDPSATDPTLKRDHPECTNGLVVALNQTESLHWFAELDAWINATSGNTIDQWILGSTSEFVNIKQSSSGIPLQNAQGYNNTKALEWFNAQDYNKNWQVGIVSKVAEYRESVPTPENTSDWFVPSAKELSLLCTGEYDDDLMGFGIMMKVAIRDLVNTKLALIEGTELLPTEQQSQYWSSSSSNSPTAFTINWYFAWVSLANLKNSLSTRYVFAF